MDVKYRYGQRPGRRRRTRVLIVLAVSLLIVGTVGAIVGYDIYKHRKDGVAQGKTRTVLQAPDESIDKLSIDEPTFTMELPSDWKEIERVNIAYEHSISWKATLAHEDSKVLKLYLDIIPANKSINRLLPVSAMDNHLVLGELSSENCSTFTQGGTVSDTAHTSNLKDAPAKWQNVNFLCDLPRIIENEVGTGSTDGINTVAVTGASKGTHKYFFLYTDHNIQPNYSIFINALKSFSAK